MLCRRMDYHVSKPINIEGLLKVLEEVSQKYSTSVDAASKLEKPQVE